MKSKRIIQFGIIALLLIFATSSIAAQQHMAPYSGIGQMKSQGAGKPYGNFTRIVERAICGSGLNGWGCLGYIYYKFDYSQSKSKAMSTCNWACDTVYPGRGECKQGCSHASSQDY